MSKIKRLKEYIISGAVGWGGGYFIGSPILLKLLGKNFINILKMFDSISSFTDVMLVGVAFAIFVIPSYYFLYYKDKKTHKERMDASWRRFTREAWAGLTVCVIWVVILLIITP